MTRVVVTGMGVLSPLGHSVASLRDAVRQGRSGIAPMPAWEGVPGLRSRVAGQLGPIDPKQVSRKARRTMGRVALLAAFAVRQAVDDAGLSDDILSRPDVGVVMGSTVGAPEAIEQFFRQYLETGGFEQTEGTLFMKVMGHTVAANVASYLGICGRVLAVSSACASSTQAIGAGFEAIRSGAARVMICGGAEDLHPSTGGVFDILKATSRAYNDRPTQTPRPFDADRDGLVLSEGAGVVVLESLDSAFQRKAPIYGELHGYATTGSSLHMTQPDVDSMYRCAETALRSARAAPEDLSYINAHATGTIVGDAAEAQAIAQLVGDRIPVSSPKGHLGHTLAGCGAIELILCLTMLQDGFVMPTLNLKQVADDCEGLQHVRALREAKLDLVMSTNFAFGGVSAVLVVGRV